MSTLAARQQSSEGIVEWTPEWEFDAGRKVQEHALYLALVPWTANECTVFLHEMSRAWQKLSDIRQSARRTSTAVFNAIKGSWRSMQRVMTIIDELKTWYAGRGPLKQFFRVRSELLYRMEVFHKGFWNSLIKVGMDSIAMNRYKGQFKSLQRVLDKCYTNLLTLPPDSIVTRLGLGSRMDEGGDPMLFVQYATAKVDSDAQMATCDIQTSPAHEWSCNITDRIRRGTSVEEAYDAELTFVTQTLGRLPESTRSQFTSLLIQTIKTTAGPDKAKLGRLIRMFRNVPAIPDDEIFSIPGSSVIPSTAMSARAQVWHARRRSF